MWIAASSLIFSASLLVLALRPESPESMETTKAVAVIVTLTGLALMATALWEGLTTDWHGNDVDGRDDR